MLLRVICKIFAGFGCVGKRQDQPLSRSGQCDIEQAQLLADGFAAVPRGSCHGRERIAAGIIARIVQLERQPQRRVKLHRFALIPV